MPCVLMHVLQAVTVFLKETSKSFRAAAVEHHTALPGKKGTVNKPKEESQETGK